MKQLPEQFYVARTWLKSMTDYYCIQKSLLPEEVLKKPLDWLCAGIQDVVDLQQAMPDIACDFLRHAVNPMLSPENFRKTIYNPIMKNAKDLRDPRYVNLGMSLLDIRLFFERNDEFLEKYFYEQFTKIQLEDLNSNNNEAKLNKFSSVMQGITLAHVNQVVEMIEDKAELIGEVTEIAIDKKEVEATT